MHDTTWEAWSWVRDVSCAKLRPEEARTNATTASREKIILIFLIIRLVLILWSLAIREVLCPRPRALSIHRPSEGGNRLSVGMNAQQMWR